MVEGYRRLVGASPLEPPASALSPSKKGSVPAQNMLFGFIAGILTVMAVASLCCLFMKEVLPFLKQRRTLKVKGKKESKSFKYDKISLRRFELEEIERATNNLSQECLLGSGGFGNVYKGNFDLEGTLAIKIAHSEPFLSVEEFRNEVRLLSTMKHRNLVGLVGYCEEPEGDGAKILVYEYVPNGSMLEYMMGNRGKSLTWKQRVKIAIGAARGMA